MASGKGTDKFRKSEYPAYYPSTIPGVGQQAYESSSDFADGFRKTESPGRNGTDMDTSNNYKRTGE